MQSIHGGPESPNGVRAASTASPSVLRLALRWRLRGTGTFCTCLRNGIPVHPHQQKTRRLFFKRTAVSVCQGVPDFTRCAQVEAASSRGRLQKKSTIFSDGALWSGRRGSNSLPGIPRMAMAIRGSPASPRMISRAARRSRQRVLGVVCNHNLRLSRRFDLAL